MRDVLDEIWDLTESEFEGFPTYFYNRMRVNLDLFSCNTRYFDKNFKEIFLD